jgi:hypothetical protein
MLDGANVAGLVVGLLLNTALGDFVGDDVGAGESRFTGLALAFTNGAADGTRVGETVSVGADTGVDGPAATGVVVGVTKPCCEGFFVGAVVVGPMRGMDGAAVELPREGASPECALPDGVALGKPDSEGLVLGTVVGVWVAGFPVGLMVGLGVAGPMADELVEEGEAVGDGAVI